MKITTQSSHAEITRRFTITENQPIVPFAYADQPKKVRVERGHIIYRLIDGAWKVQNSYSVTVGGTVLKKDGSDSKLDHRRSADTVPCSGLRGADLTEKLTDDFQWLAPIINLLRPTGDVTMTIAEDYEVNG